MQNFNGDSNLNEIILDPFSETITTTSDRNKIHLRVQKRSGKKNITIIEGLSKDLDLKSILKFLKKKLNCSGSIHKDTNDNSVIQLTGDQRDSVAKIFIAENIVSDTSSIIMHGF